jgi:protein-disulfide isomerase
MTTPSSNDRPAKKQRQEIARENARIAREKAAAQKRRRRFFIQGGLALGVIAVVAIVGLVIWTSTRPPSPGPLNMLSDGMLFEGDGTTISPIETKAIQPGKLPVATDQTDHADTVNIVIYLDYLCPICGQFETANASQIEEWVTAGVATLEIHPISILDRSSSGSRYSTRAANTFACVANYDPDNAFAVSGALFVDQPAEGTTGRTNGELVDVVTGAGVSNTKVNDCITGETFSGWVADATDRALTGPIPNADVTAVAGTPTVIVNGTKYTGAVNDATAFYDFVGQLATAGQ